MPAGLREALATGNRWQDLLTGNFTTGRTGNQVLKETRREAEQAGIVSATYTHPLGFFGHAPGPTIGMYAWAPVSINASRAPSPGVITELAPSARARNASDVTSSAVARSPVSPSEKRNTAWTCRLVCLAWPAVVQPPAPLAIEWRQLRCRRRGDGSRSRLRFRRVLPGHQRRARVPRRRAGRGRPRRRSGPPGPPFPPAPLVREHPLPGGVSP